MPQRPTFRMVPRFLASVVVRRARWARPTTHVYRLALPLDRWPQSGPAPTGWTLSAPAATRAFTRSGGIPRRLRPARRLPRRAAARGARARRLGHRRDVRRRRAGDVLGPADRPLRARRPRCVRFRPSRADEPARGAPHSRWPCSPSPGSSSGPPPEPPRGNVVVAGSLGATRPDRPRRCRSAFRVGRRYVSFGASAGINRHGEGDERALHRRSSDPRWPRVMRRRS